MNDQPNPAPSGPVLPILGHAATIAARGEKCQCQLCQRGRRFHEIIKALPDADQDWMSGLYDGLMDTECELEMREAADKPPDPAPPQPAPEVIDPQNEPHTCPYCDQPREDTFEHQFRFKCGTSLRRIDHKTVKQSSECKLRVDYSRLVVENTRLKCGTPQELATAPDRHEASRAAFEKAFAEPREWKLERLPSGFYRDVELEIAWDAWRCALDHAAQEQPAPEPTQGSAREWVRAKLFKAALKLNMWAIHMDDALELADRADAAEWRLADAIDERDQLKYVFDRNRKGMEEAQELVDSGCWAGYPLIEAVNSELKACRTQLAAARAELAALRAEQATPQCKWEYDDVDDAWDTDCGKCFTFADMQNTEGLMFCCNCGRRTMLPAAPPRDLREGES